MRFFNTAGPVNLGNTIASRLFERFDLATVLLLIAQEKYFVLHAPRQTGKTSALLALMDHLNAQGTHRCVYINVEVGQAAREDVAAAMRAILGELATQARLILNDSFVDDIWDEAFSKHGPYGVFGEVLSRWAAHHPTPLVVLVDEIDALVGDTLLALLRQLRAKYPWRPQHFPQSVVLCGVRDVRDYRIHSTQEKAIITGVVRLTSRRNPCAWAIFPVPTWRPYTASIRTRRASPAPGGSGARLGAHRRPAMAGECARVRHLFLEVQRVGTVRNPSPPPP